ncbi:MFS monosaccharide transporter [Histoplasma capsulatum var. duboisii H88]|uniref:MFS monosaccharide transporter n=2 Tax=Ajellomyces capsulatus TaxID=5037 RepID=F0US45_AJEC8|nr:MFS monosaccharide transporter [Histoplasma capsulatum var. duboisii H88]
MRPLLDREKYFNQVPPMLICGKVTRLPGCLVAAVVTPPEALRPQKHSSLPTRECSIHSPSRQPMAEISIKFPDKSSASQSNNKPESFDALPILSCQMLPTAIPLRSLSPHSRPSPDSHSVLLASSREKEGNRRLSSSSLPSSPSTDSDSDSNFSVWSDTGDLAEQLASEEDPLQIHLNRSLEHSSFGRSCFRSRGKRSKRVHYPADGHRHGTHPQQDDRGQVNTDSDGGLFKEIHIPTPAPRTISRAERILAVIMSPGAARKARSHGLVGKPLLGADFKDYFNQPTMAEVGTMVAILEIGAFISSLIVGKIGDIIGRTRTILYGSMVFFVGGAFQTFATGIPMMLVGRIVAGLGVGALSTIVPVYQSEISPPHNRGKLACIEFTGNICGYAASVWVDYFCSYIPNNWAWRLPLMCQCFMGALLGLGSLIICESPRWLLDTDRDEEGMVVIANLYGGGDLHNDKARQEYRDIKMGVLIQRQEGERTYRDMFRRYSKRVFIAMSAQAFAQLNGINVISYYAPLVFESAGMMGRKALLMTGINSLSYLASTIPPWYLVDRWGRRPILLSGAVAMITSLSFISYWLYLDIKLTPILTVVFVMIYNAAFGASWGPIPWLYPPEILPLSIRAKGASLSTASNWAFNWLVGEITPVLQEIYFVYPETSGIRLEDMDAIFGDGATAVTPATPAERDALMGIGSPVPSLDIRRSPDSYPSAEHSIPGLDINPPESSNNNNKFDQPDTGTVERSNPREGIGAWLASVVGRGRNSSKKGDQGRYSRLGQDDEG